MWRAEHHASLLDQPSYRSNIYDIHDGDDIEKTWFDNYLHNMQITESFHLREMNITDLKCEAIALQIDEGNLDGVKELILYGNQISHKGLSALAKAVSERAPLILKPLSLARNAFGFEGIRVLSDYLGQRGFLELEFLNLNMTEIRDDGMNVFAHTLSSDERALAHCIFLDLGSNYISADGMETFAKAMSLGRLPVLTHLRLQKNTISDVGVSALAESASNGSRKKLKRLDLDENNIGDEGMVALANAVPMFSDFEHLSLKKNSIGDVGLIALSGAIEQGGFSHRMNLNLEKNQLGDTGMIRFSRALAKASAGYIEINFDWNDKISNEGFFALAETIKNHDKDNQKIMISLKHPMSVGRDYPKVLQSWNKNSAYWQ